jgi:hypothetical protein
LTIAEEGEHELGVIELARLVIMLKKEGKDSMYKSLDTYPMRVDNLILSVVVACQVEIALGQNLLVLA